MYTGSLRTTSRRCKLLRQAAVKLGVGRLVDAIDEQNWENDVEQSALDKRLLLITVSLSEPTLF